MQIILKKHFKYDTINNIYERRNVMLLEFSCKNYKSIKDKITFSAIASKDDLYEDELKQFSNFRILRTAAIYGPNGSGKSNFIESIKFMKGLVANSINSQPGELIYQSPHKKSTIEEPSEFNMQFIKNDIRYAYGFSLKNNLIHEEYLYFFPKGRPVKIFERLDSDLVLGDKYKKSKALIETGENKLKNNRLFLSCAANDTNIQEIESAFLFFSKDIIIYNSNRNNWKEASIKLMQENHEIKNIFVKILQDLGTGIKDIKVKYEENMIDMSDFQNDIPDKIKRMLKHKMSINCEAKIVYDDFETDLDIEESTGIKKLFEIICPIIDVLIKGKVIIFDEIETGLHESVAYEIIEIFKTFKSDKFPQLFFTTHDTSLLDSNLLRRDQIWFTELDKNRSTNLYSLSEIKNVRKGENLAKGYVMGRYGAIPMLNKNFSEIFNDICNSNGGE